MGETLTAYAVVCADGTQERQRTGMTSPVVSYDLATVTHASHILDDNWHCGPHRVVAMVPAEAVACAGSLTGAVEFLLALQAGTADEETDNNTEAAAWAVVHRYQAEAAGV